MSVAPTTRMIVLGSVAMVLLCGWLHAQNGSQSASPEKRSERGPEKASEESRGRVEISFHDDVVSSGYGHWSGVGLHLFWQPNARAGFSGGFLNQRRLGQWEHLATFGARVRLSDSFATEITASGGGPDNPSGFLPRFRYDLGAMWESPVPGLLLTSGYTRIYFGNPVGGRIARAGAILYRGRFVVQGDVYFYNARPGNHGSKSAGGAIQYGREGRYWAGLRAGGGREAWQTQGIAPAAVAFTGYSISPFFRKWLKPDFGLAGTYTYSVKHAAYSYNGAELRAFWQF